MVDYVSKRICPRTILEPAAGDGRFISPLFKFNVPITAVELEEEKAKDLRKKWGDLCTIVDGDFLKFSLEHETKFDLIIGNPPYITKKMMIKEQCDRSFNLVNQFSLNASLFQNMWVSFLLASIKLLSPTGAIFFVLPFEFLQVQYAEKLRIFLEKKFNTIEITTFELSKNSALDKYLVEKVTSSLDGMSIYDELTKSDIDSLIEAFQKIEK